MSRKEDNKLSPETRVNLLCALAVLVLCLLLSGDMIVSHFIPVHPNDNYVKEKEFEKREEEGNPSDNNYEISCLPGTMALQKSSTKSPAFHNTAPTCCALAQHPFSPPPGPSSLRAAAQNRS